MSRALFLSDIHITSTADDKCLLFIRVLDTVRLRGFSHLFLVGDIFDLWIADRRYFVENYSPVISKIKELIAAGVEVHYFEGNHDLDLEVYWRDVAGVRTHAEAEYFQLDGKTVRVEHGDQMDPDDRGYLFLRWLLRTPVMRFLGRHLPDVAVAWIGRKASAASRDYTSQVKTIEASQSIEKTRTHARLAYKEKQFDVFVSGHTHTLEDSMQDGFRCINLGSWFDNPHVLTIEGGEARLLSLDGFLR